MQQRHDAPGWFGKVASLGDFASRRLPDGWVAACDRWLSDGIAASRQRLGPRWLDVYLSAPVWRFAWAPGVADSQWWFGVLMPSCDNVGRYFPLVVAQSRPWPAGDRIALDHLELWWARAAEAALRTLADGRSAEHFESELCALPPWPASGAVMPVVPGTSESPWRQALRPHADLGSIALATASGLLQQRLQRSSFWWPMRASGAGSCTVVPGLPPASAFADMLVGGF